MPGSSYYETCDVLLRAAANEAEKKAQRRATREAEVWLSIRGLMAPLTKLRALGINKPDKYLRDDQGREAGLNAEFTTWVTDVYEVREDIQTRLRNAHEEVRYLYGLPMGNSLCGQIALEMDMVLTMLEHTYKQLDANTSTA